MPKFANSKNRRTIRGLWLLHFALLWAGTSAFCAQVIDEESAPAEEQASPQRMARTNSGPRRVFRDQVAPHWFKNDSRFWYRNDLREGAKEFVLVDAEKGIRAAAFDHQKLAASLSKVGDLEVKPDRSEERRVGKECRSRWSP